jgi:hypothetical protein
MVSTTTCPSIYDCTHPAELPKNEWSLLYADSQEVNDPGLAVMSFDNDPSTIWHTRWSTGIDPYPHEIRIDLGNLYRVSKFTYLTRQDGENGRIRDYQLYISMDTLNWGPAVSTGQWINTAAPQTIVLDSAMPGHYFRLVALSEVNGGPWASAAEFSLTGCMDYPAGTTPATSDHSVKAFPIPTGGIVKVDLPAGTGYTYRIVSASGDLIETGNLENATAPSTFNLSDAAPGVYLIIITDSTGVRYRVKVVKE